MDPAKISDVLHWPTLNHVVVQNKAETDGGIPLQTSSNIQQQFLNLCRIQVCVNSNVCRIHVLSIFKHLIIYLLVMSCVMIVKHYKKIIGLYFQIH